MKIVFLSAACSIHTARWVNALAQRGNEIHLISLCNHTEVTQSPISPQVKIHYLPVSGFKGYFLNFFFLKKLLKELSPDILNCHYASGYGTLSGLVKFQPTILNVWGSDIYEFPTRSPVHAALLKKNLKKAGYIASTSKAMSLQLREYTDKPVFITPFGVDIDCFAYNVPADKNECVFGVVKTLTENYGIDVIIRAFHRVLATYQGSKKIRLEIYGKGPQEKQLMDLCRTLAIDNLVIFKGYVEHQLIPEILGKIDIFCLGSLQESFGVAAIEAMSVGVPVIASDADGFREIIVDGETGFIVPRLSVEKMAEMMTKLVDSYSWRVKIGMAARKHVEKLYDFDKNVDHMISIYKSIL